MPTEKDLGFGEVDLHRLRWRGVWLPTLAIGFMLLVEGILENYPMIKDWKTHLLFSHVLMIGIVSLGTYLFSRSTFALVRRSQDKILRQREEIARSERRFRALIENGTDYIALLDRDGVIQYVSPSFVRILGYTLDDTTRRSVFDLIVPYDHEKLRNTVHKSQQVPGSVLSESCRIYHKNGDWHWVDVSLTNLLMDPEVEAIVWNARDVTRWKQAEDRMRSLTEGLPVGVYRSTPGGELLDANPALAQMLGCANLQELLATKVASFYADPDDRTRWQELMACHGLVRDFEFRGRRKDGTVIWLKDTARFVRDEHKGITCYEGAVEDVTERKRAEQTLIDKQAQLAGILGSAMDAIVTLDSEQHIVLFNLAAEEMFGCSAREAMAKPIERFLPKWRHVNQPEGFPAPRQSGATDKRGWRPDRLIGLRPHGKEFPIDAVVWKTISGGETFFTLSMRDSSERLKAEDMLRKLSLAIDQTTESVFITDHTGVIEYVNPAFERLTGYGRDEAIGRTPNILKSGKHDAVFYGKLWTTLLAGKVHSCVFLNRKKTGEHYYEDQTIAPICDHGQHITHFVAAGRDITERKRTEEALRRLNAQLEREAERIAHTLHDEAGQFLTSVHITLADVARDLPAPARTRMSEVRTHLEEIEAQLRRLSHEMRPRILDDLGLAAALDFLADGFMKRTGVVVTTEVAVDERLPPVVETTLYRFVQEGLTNAAKHARPQRINVAISRDAQTVRCAVRDDGAGFDAAEVFARRGEPSLGLVGIRDRVEALGGTLTITSHPGQGTELNALIPLGNDGT